MPYDLTDILTDAVASDASEIHIEVGASMDDLIQGERAGDASRDPANLSPEL